MNPIPGPVEIDAELTRTSGAQSAASDPDASVWVSANAGTGKTHVLTMRVLRLLLSGTAPERILCLTYTKAAASEMSKRVFAELAKWVMLADDDLAGALRKLLSRDATSNEMARARTLFTASIETPGGFKVQTIHAFAERLLQRFPLEAGVTPGFAILDEVMARELKRNAIDEVLTEAAGRPDDLLGMALTIAVAHAADDRFDEILDEALQHRDWLDTAIRLPTFKKGIERAEGLLRQHFGVRDGAMSGELMAAAAIVLSDADCRHLSDLFSTGGKRDGDRASLLREIAATSAPAARSDLLKKLFFDSKGEPRTSFATKGVAKEYPETETKLAHARDRFVSLWTEMKGAELVEATIALYRLTDAVLQRYQDAKARRAALDFEDLIGRTRNLLRTRSSAEWVLYKLDSGLDHLLVDESQDTSPSQWDVVGALAQEFFAGSGTRDTPRTIFAVGDEKQSIYSFQGAAPEMFARKGSEFRQRAESAEATFRKVDLNVSFRTTAPVLAAVDKVFADHSRTPGVPTGTSGIRHIAKRIGQAGSVEVWRPEAYADTETADPWSPLEEAPTTVPSLRLANRIADTIKGWIDSRTMLPSAGRPIRAGDVLILVRKRRPFAGPMVAALKARGVQVAGADRLQLAQHIAVQDLLSVGHFLTLPEDDLSLAEALKSPIFNLDDEDLLRIANGRRGTLWKALLENAGADARYADAAETLKRWRKAADFTPPYEFWASLLDRDGVRARLIGRLGPDATDPIDEFLNLALTYDDKAPASLTGFLHTLTSEDREIKRDTEHARDEVRVMTVHGAKGLEAPIVFLPDTCATGANANRGGRPIRLDGLRLPGDGTASAFVWPVKGTTALEPVRHARGSLEQRDAEERDRLLYVAMTRARDRLIIAGFEGKKGRAPGCWYDTVCTALGADPDAPGEDIVIYLSETKQAADAAPDAKDSARVVTETAQPRPLWAERPAPRERTRSVPLVPSRLAPYEIDEEGEPLPADRPADPFAEPPAPSPRRTGSDATNGDRFLRGSLTHALLEHLPTIASADWRAAADKFLEVRAPQLPARSRYSIAKEALAILNDPAFGMLFGAGSRAEVPVVAEIPHPSGHGTPLRLTGQIDRIAITDEAVLIIDYKTNRTCPTTSAEVAEVYLYQLAAYRLALEQIFSGKPVRAALLWTEGPQLMEIPAEILDAYSRRLWQLDPAHLDAAASRS